MIVEILIIFLLTVYAMRNKKDRPPLASGDWPVVGHTFKGITNTEATAMGVAIDDKDVNLRKKYLRAKDEYASNVIFRGQRFSLQGEFIYNISKLKRIQYDLANTLHGLTNEIIKNRKEELEKIEDRTEKRFKPFMEQLLDMEKDGAISSKEVQEEVDSFTFGGSDTTFSALTTTVLVIGTYPDVQRKIVDELQEAFQGSLRDVEKQDLLQLKYLEAVIKENLRLFPSVPFLGRTLNKDIKIRSTFALMSMKTTLAHILRHYYVSGDVTELRRKLGLIARPLPKDYISIERRIFTE